MAKGPSITLEVEALVANVHKKHPKWKAPEIRNTVDGLLHKDDPALPKGWPSLSSVQKILAPLRRNKGKPGSQDEPWSLASLASNEYRISPEAMPAVMAFYEKRLAEGDILTIREALWAARLYRIVEPLDLLFDWAFRYAIDELIAQESGKPFKSQDLDLELIKNPQSARELRRDIDIWTIATKYRADPLQLKELNLSIEETEQAAKSGKYHWEGWDEAGLPMEVNNDRKHKPTKNERRNPKAK